MVKHLAELAYRNGPGHRGSSIAYMEASSSANRQDLDAVEKRKAIFTCGIVILITSEAVGVWRVVTQLKEDGHGRKGEQVNHANCSRVRWGYPVHCRNTYGHT